MNELSHYIKLRSGLSGCNAKQYQKPFVPKYANYDYTKVYDGNGRFIGWIKIYHTLKRR